MTTANDIQITAAASSNLQEAQDPVSQYIYQGQRSYSRTDLLLSSDAEALQYANWVLFVSKNNEDRFDTLTIDPLADTTGLYPQVLGREIGDRVQVWRRPSGFSGAVTKDVFIRGITHSFDTTTSAWQTVWTLQSAAKYGSFLTLDSTLLGLLDVDALVY